MMQWAMDTINEMEAEREMMSKEESSQADVRKSMFEITTRCKLVKYVYHYNC